MLGEMKISRVVRRMREEERREQRIYREAEGRNSWEAAAHGKAPRHES